MVNNALRGENVFNNVDKALGAGLLGGASHAIGKDIFMGTPKPLPDNDAVKNRIGILSNSYGKMGQPVYRGGGIWGFLANDPLGWLGIHGGILRAGFAGYGRDIIINETGRANKDAYLWVHETVHYWQYCEYGYDKALGRLGYEQFRDISPNIDAYKMEGWLEWQADYIEEKLRKFVY